jgi:hypothetical protein
VSPLPTLICTWMHIYVLTPERTHMRAHTCVHTRAQGSDAYAHTCTHEHTCSNPHICMCIYMDTRVHMHTRMHMHAHTHTHTHTHTALSVCSRGNGFPPRSDSGGEPPSQQRCSEADTMDEEPAAWHAGPVQAGRHPEDNQGQTMGETGPAAHKEHPARPELRARLAQGRPRDVRRGAAPALAGTDVSGCGWPVQP